MLWCAGYMNISYAMEGEADWYVITSTYKQGIAVHPSPDKDSDVLIRIPYGTRFAIYDYNKNYGYTEYTGVEGWINLDYAQMISLNGNTVDYYRITDMYAEGIAMHPEPDKNSDVILRIPYYSVFPVYDYIDGTDYGFIKYAGEEGYLNLSYADYVGSINIDEISFEQSDEDKLVYEYVKSRYGSNSSGAYWDCTTIEDPYSTPYGDENVYTYSVTSYTGAIGIYYLNPYTGEIRSQWKPPHLSTYEDHLTVEYNLYAWISEEF